jgi:hypothetical protein
MQPQQHQSNALKERQIQLALQALKQDASLSQQRAAAIYSVPQSTLSQRRAGHSSRIDTIANSRNLTNAEEQVIITHILDLAARGESPWLAAVTNIANSLRKERGLAPVSPQ